MLSAAPLLASTMTGIGALTTALGFVAGAGEARLVLVATGATFALAGLSYLRARNAERIVARGLHA